jgi:hypothetical protein
MNYKEQLQDPRWIAKRNRIIKRDKVCQKCGSSKRLEAHHLMYNFDLMPWEYDDDFLLALCHDCHGQETKDVKELKELIKEMLKMGIWANEIRLKIKDENRSETYCCPNCQAIEWFNCKCDEVVNL